MSVMVTASADRSSIECNQAKFYLVKLIELEQQASAKGEWVCGLPRLYARKEVETACKVGSIREKAAHHQLKKTQDD